MTQDKIEQIAEKWKGAEGALIGALQEIQLGCNYVPPETLPVVARRLDIPLSQVYSVVTFYNSFSLEPRGKHIVTCCLGTACHVRGGDRIAREVSRLLRIEPDETTPDKQFTFETVRCLGACALAPVVVIDGQYHGKMRPEKLRNLLGALQQGEEDQAVSIDAARAPSAPRKTRGEG